MASVGSGNNLKAVPNFHSTAFLARLISMKYVFIDIDPSFLSTREQCILHHHVSGSSG